MPIPYTTDWYRAQGEKDYRAGIYNSPAYGLLRALAATSDKLQRNSCR